MKIFQRVVHGVAVVVTGGALYALILIVSSLVYFRWMFESMGGDAGKMQESMGYLTHIIWVKWVLAVVLLALGVFAIIRKLRWRILLPGLLLVVAGLLWLHWDGEAPPQPDLGPRVTEDDPGFRIYMWMSKDSPYSRLGQGGVLEDDRIKVLALPKEIAGWPEHVRLHRKEILLAWEEDRLGREWIDAINGCPPAGVWTQGLKSTLIKFAPIRLSMFARTARAYTMAIDGRRDEAIESLLPMITAWRHIERTGPALMNQMIAQVMLKQCYRVAGEILRMGDVGRETKTKLASVLRQVQVTTVFRNALLGEYDWLADSVDEGLATAQREQQKKGGRPWLSRIAPTAMASGNQTKRDTLRSLERPCELAIHRDMTGLEKLGKESQSKWYLKNPVGSVLIKMATPTYTKIVEQVWQVEDLRLDLLKQLEKP